MRRTSRAVAALILAGVPLLVSAGGVPPDGSSPYLPGSATRGPSSVSDTAAVAGPGRFPGELLDLRNWYLTLPSGVKGSPDTVEQPALATYADSWFGLDDAGDGVVFTANAGGVTTKNTSYPRSELREMNGSQKASWSNTSGTHILEVRQAVLAVPPAKPEVVTAQIHDTSSDVVEIRLEGTRLIAQYDDGNEDVTVDPSYVLGTPFNLRIVAASGRIDVFYNDERKAEITQAGSGWYFKTGSYLQSNPSKGEQSDAVAQVVLYSVTVTHSA